ncbi:protein FAM161B isoform X3 [Mirounga leonina]|uniref:protein FAM161B isoform X3 n=1 Tax=Mirounga leonina TaxID=9715 RepID=UPI00156BF16A|nr:protein FAM161B isoform X3 [Mirounga leonina]
MTIGKPPGAPGGAQWSRQVFPPKSSSDSDTEEELSGDGLVLPRAGKLDDFLGPEDLTLSESSDSTGSFYETLEEVKQKGRWCLLESLYQSDPDSGENFSEDDEDLESFFQDEGRGKPQVQYPVSPRCGPTRRCSSLSSLPSDDPKGQPPPPSGSRPPSQHRSRSSWASSLTVPRPFHMTLREAQKKAQWLASPASFERERKQAQRQGQEEAECHRQFRAQPVPAHVYLPLYREITERSEARRQAGIQKRKELLLSSLKPFSFLVKEEQRKEAAKQRELAATAKAKVPKQKATRRIPKSILEPALGDKLQEAELFRKIRIQMRALDMLQKASSPVAFSGGRPDPQPRTATRTQKEKLAFLHPDFGFQPRDSPQPPATPLPRSRSLSGLASLSAHTLPVHITDITRKRESAVRSSLEKKDKADESTQWLEMHKKKCQAMSKSVTLRAKAMDPHQSLEEVFKAKLKENRNKDRKRAKEYKKELEEMKKRIQTRPYLFEQVTKDLARRAAEQRYRDTLQQAGLDEDFVRNKGQGSRVVRWREQSEVRDCPSTHETTKLSTRNAQQDLEESLQQPTSPKKELEELSYELLDNFKSLA